MARVVLKRAALPDQDIDIILVHLTHNAITPWVTWQVNLYGDDDETYWGHYHMTLEEATEEFHQRCKNKFAVEYTNHRPSLAANGR